MSKKVLIISASPRKNGNSETLCDEFLKGAVEAGHDVEKVSLANKKIGFCTGCYACTKLGKCVQDDDVQDILDKLVEILPTDKRDMFILPEITSTLLVTNLFFKKYKELNFCGLEFQKIFEGEN